MDKLRADYKLVRDWFVRYEEWTADEAAEIGAGIAEAVKVGDAGELAFWAWWFDRYATAAAAHQAHMDALAKWAAGLVIKGV